MIASLISGWASVTLYSNITFCQGFTFYFHSHPQSNNEEGRAFLAVDGSVVGIKSASTWSGRYSSPFNGLCKTSFAGWCCLDEWVLEALLLERQARARGSISWVLVFFVRDRGNFTFSIHYSEFHCSGNFRSRETPSGAMKTWSCLCVFSHTCPASIERHFGWETPHLSKHRFPLFFKFSHLLAFVFVGFGVLLLDNFYIDKYPTGLVQLFKYCIRKEYKKNLLLKGKFAP